MSNPDESELLFFAGLCGLVIVAGFALYGAADRIARGMEAAALTDLAATERLCRAVEGSAAELGDMNLRVFRAVKEANKEELQRLRPPGKD